MSSAVSTASYLTLHGFKGKKVYVIGEPGLHTTLNDAGVSHSALAPNHRSPAAPGHIPSVRGHSPSAPGHTPSVHNHIPMSTTAGQSSPRPACLCCCLCSYRCVAFNAGAPNVQESMHCNNCAAAAAAPADVVAAATSVVAPAFVTSLPTLAMDTRYVQQALEITPASGPHWRRRGVLLSTPRWPRWSLGGAQQPTTFSS
jgi:ribonucleotide monophosphatase NagD (HAD superfamily)